MGEAKRRRSFAEQGIERMSGYDCGPSPTPLMQALLDTLHVEAAKAPNGMLDSQDAVAALTFHLVQTMRSMPETYRQKKIDEVCGIIRELGVLPFKPEQVMHLGPEGEA